ncbi:Wzz/FepE/Etk N-terminal domain-containing protein [Weissella cibaria]|uniref:Wzz/FepE/Etk N-terminal domain-containing protein n=1 Tax=Weissella cibaria TaxID=137591 RepID=UPI00155560B6|nr:Wzz/FepE/Etk N-terminal domain-containing protein [Weissella cibaria]
MEEYRLVDLFGILKKRILIILLLSLVSGIGGYYAVDKWNSMNPKYTATTYFVVAHSNDEKKDSLKYQTQVYAQQYNSTILKTVTKLVTTPKVVGNSIRKVERDSRYTNQQLYGTVAKNTARNIGVGNDKDTMLVTVTYAASNAKYAAAMSNELFIQTKKEVERIWGTSDLKLVNKVIEPAFKTEVSKIKVSVIITVGIFIVLSGAYIFGKLLKNGKIKN